MMQNRKLVRLGKFLLLAVLSLSCIAATEAGQQVVKAIGTEMISQVAPPASDSLTDFDSGANSESHSLNRPTTSASPAASPAASPVASPAASPASAGAQSAKPAADSIAQSLAFDSQAAAQTNLPTGARPNAQAARQALNAGTGGQPVQQMSSSQIVAATWQGASFPVENFQAYTSPFGYRSSPYGGYSQEFHYGLDMAAPEGSYIRTWWSGKVVEVSDDSNCGTSVVIDSGDWTHIYCHMQGHVETEDGKKYMIDREGGIQIWEDQQIQAGARLGRVGMTGRTTGPHLHWGLKYDQNWVDPALVLRAMYVNQPQAAVSSEAK